MKKTGPWALMLAAIFVLAGCGGGNAKELVPGEAAQAILDGVEFRNAQSLLQADEGIAGDYYKLEGISDYCIYIDSSGGTAEEIAVLQVEDAADIQTARDAVDKRVDDLIFRFEDYRPEEMPKLKSPVIETVGNTVILVLTDDAQGARKVIGDIAG